MNKAELVLAFTKMGDHLLDLMPEGQESVAIYLTGSAAAILHGDLERDAKDCDKVGIRPLSCAGAVEEAASLAADELDLDPEWLNDQAMFFADYLPAGFLDRAEAVGTFGPLTVYSLSRGDLIASKAIGAIKVDDDKHLVDFDAMAVTKDEIDAAIEAIKESSARNNEDFGESIKFLEQKRKT